MTSLSTGEVCHFASAYGADIFRMAGRLNSADYDVAVVVAGVDASITYSDPG
jgi:hypothetical protein